MYRVYYSVYTLSMVLGMSFRDAEKVAVVTLTLFICSCHLNN